MSIHVTVHFPVAAFTQKSRAAMQKCRPALKQQIIKDCNANVPLRHGFLRNSALRWASLANDLIVWDTPYAHFQYIGKVMIGEHSHSPWARKGERKIYTDRDMTYRQGGSRWIDKTISERMPAWQKLLANLMAEEMNR